MTLRLSQILFLSAGALLAVLLAVAGYVSSVPSAGQYWGLDPNISPEAAAEEAFTEGDFRFLGARIYFKESKEAEMVYGIFNCVDHPLGNGWPNSYARYAELDGMDARAIADSIRDFADSYNFRLWDLLEEHTDTRCSGYDVG